MIVDAIEFLDALEELNDLAGKILAAPHPHSSAGQGATIYDRLVSNLSSDTRRAIFGAWPERIA